MLFRIIYMSRATRTVDRAELVALCTTSTRRNEEVGVTGLFLYDGIRFLQAIEGEEAPVRATMARIAGDDRHHEIAYSFCDPVDAREFPQWSMEQPYEDGDPDLFVDKVKRNVDAVSDPYLRAQFIGFARLASVARNRI